MTSLSKKKETRIALRIPFQTSVRLSFVKEGYISGEMIDISMFGMYARCEVDVTLGSRCLVNIFIVAPHTTLELKDIKARVMRHGDDGLGLQFIHPFEWYALFSVYGCYGRPQ